MKNKNHDFSEYMDNSKILFKMLFGEELFEKLISTPLKSIDWNGIDVDCHEITATFPNIKKRFNDDWIEKFSDSDQTLFDLYIQVVFHYGYQQCFDYNSHYYDLIDKIIKNENIIPKIVCIN